MLKTIINVHIDGSLIIGQGPGIQGQPTLEFVKAALAWAHQAAVSVCAWPAISTW
jgi:hypothetical protein